ncbi:unnamed protein product [Soboliphyme baturini]|uniref:Cadherin domain-containing protein n=1 Tax=Soboliphyme baturini TaxID=241478 RepID=A0A183J816_9BILA|nr:unnamed protein product [Soboliphyme baturini]
MLCFVADDEFVCTVGLLVVTRLNESLRLLMKTVGNVAQTTLIINIDDVNDNAPYLNITRDLVAWENVNPPQFLGIVCAYDPDGPDNGPPFIMYQSSESPYKRMIKIDYIRGVKPEYVIGRIFVEDLDDWDASDKTYEWIGSPSDYFSLEKDGLIRMSASTPAGSYVVKANVKDTVNNQHAVGSVDITVELLPDEAIRNAASFVLRGMLLVAIACRSSQFLLYVFGCFIICHISF